MTQIAAAIAGEQEAITHVLRIAACVPFVFLAVVGLVLWLDDKGWLL